MKFSYVSFVLRLSQIDSRTELEQLDLFLSRISITHELIIAIDTIDVLNLRKLTLSSPLTLVRSFDTRFDNQIVNSLAVAVGDFVIFWNQKLKLCDEKLLTDVLTLTDRPSEIVEIVRKKQEYKCRYRFINLWRSENSAIKPLYGVVLSRRALDSLLINISSKKILEIDLANLSLPRAEIDLEDNSELTLISDLGSRKSIFLLANGTSFGSRFPLVFSFISIAFGLGAAIYSLSFYAFTGSTPEGWVTLMTLLGLSQSMVFAFLGLIWMRVNDLYQSKQFGFMNQTEIETLTNL